jgi:NADP-dependent 3-hydroxy acid dehydrogenase YdfG
LKSVLIIGGTSSLAKPIISKLENQGYTIDLMTYRQEDKKYEDYSWVYLDLENQQNVNEFIYRHHKNKYSKIIFLSGNSLGKEIKQVDPRATSNYYQSYLINYVSIIISLLKYLDDEGQIIFISSIAANIPIQDAHYSAVKAGVEAFIRSLSIQLKENQSAFSIVPGTITDFTREQISSIIADSDKTYNGMSIDIK